MNKDDKFSDFEKAFQRLIAHELPHARRDAHRLAAFMEIQARALAMTIAMGAGGDGKRAEIMMQMNEELIAYEVTRLAPLSASVTKGGNAP